MRRLYDAIPGMPVGSGVYPNDGWHYQYLRRAGDMARVMFDGESIDTPNMFMCDARLVSVFGSGNKPRYMAIGG